MAGTRAQPEREQSLALVLASRSPQRRAILERLGVPFEVRPSDVPELADGEPRAVALENALRKARAAQAPAGAEAVLGCDTIVTLDGVALRQARRRARGARDAARR